MSTPFEIGKAVAGNISGGFQQGIETSALDEILQNAAQSDNPNAMDLAMNQIITSVQDPDRRKVAVDVLQQRAKQVQQSKQLTAEDVISLRKGGLNDAEIELYGKATPGGRTQIVKESLQRQQREATGLPGASEAINETIKTQDAGLNFKERASAQAERFKVNTPLIKKTRDSLNAMKAESRRYDLLETLNERDNLPSGFQLLNVDKRGNLRVPALASPEAQLFSKTINEFLQNAKDSFGARVTNFEVDLFLKRLPNLWNSKDGRKLLLRQLKIVNQINQLKDQGLIDTFKSAGGARRIDFDLAENHAETATADRVSALEEEYRNIEGQLEGGENLLTKGDKKSNLKPLTRVDFNRLLQQANGNPDEAERLAREEGFDVK